MKLYRLVITPSDIKENAFKFNFLPVTLTKSGYELKRRKDFYEEVKEWCINNLNYGEDCQLIYDYENHIPEIYSYNHETSMAIRIKWE